MHFDHHLKVGSQRNILKASVLYNLTLLLIFYFLQKEYNFQEQMQSNLDKGKTSLLNAKLKMLEKEMQL